MKKKGFFFVFFIYSFLSFSQQNDSTLFYFANQDTIKFFLDNAGNITNRSKAIFFRNAKIDRKNFSYTGRVTDYYLNNTLAFECNYTNNLLNGIVKSYYPNGKLKYSGNFSNSKRDSIWVFYYDNGNIEKVIEFKDSVPCIKEFYKHNGKVVFNDGNGKYTGASKYNINDPQECRISGRVINGKMEGAWHWNSTTCHGIDYFKDGKYVKGENWGLNDGFVEPRVVNLFGIDPNENTNIFRFLALPQDRNENNIVLKGVPVVFTNKDIASTIYYNSSDPNNQPLKYNGTSDLDKAFTNDFTKYIVDIINNNEIGNFWCFSQFTVNSNNEVENTCIWANNSIISQSVTNFLNKKEGFDAVRVNGKAINCDIYFVFYFENGIIYFPEYNYDNQPKIF